MCNLTINYEIEVNIPTFLVKVFFKLLMRNKPYLLICAPNDDFFPTIFFS